MILHGRGVSPGEAQGKVVKVNEPVSFLGDVDPEYGIVFNDVDISDSIFVFPKGKGSTVGSYVIYQLKKNGCSPRAIVNEETETIVAAGAIISDIPLVDMIDTDLLKYGDNVLLDGNSGELELQNISSFPVVTSFIEKSGKVLVVKRSDKVGSFQGRWSAVSGYLERKDPLEQAIEEIREETKMDVELVNNGDVIFARGDNNIWEVHPYLFETQDEPVLNWENTEYRWVTKEELKKLKTVPKLIEAYDEVKV
ncbi:MAG: DUF126 domain-containing protein [Candidatus Saliniplasma sp.]